MTAESVEVSSISGVETRPVTTVRGEGLVDLDATLPPPIPANVKWPVVSVRMPSPLYAYVREAAHLERCSINAWIVRALTKSRDGALPGDVRDWLATQAGQCGCPGDPDRALIEVVRHLAVRWPDGGRLR